MKTREEIEALAAKKYPEWSSHDNEKVNSLGFLIVEAQRLGFREGYEQVQNDSQWISVDKRLPDAGVEVYVLYFTKSPVMDGLVYGLMKRITHKTAITFNSLDSNGFTSLGGVVKYWMPKPPKPTK
jgi:hypothetical protein